MFTIFIRTLSADGEVENTSISGAVFQERKDAVASLDKMVKQHPNAGYDAKQDLWWTRENGPITHYTIGA